MPTKIKDIRLLKEALDLIVYKFQKYPLLEMRAWFSNDFEFANFIQRFAGCWIYIPEMVEMAEICCKVLAADGVRRLRHARSRGDLVQWGIEEGRLGELAIKFGISKDKLGEIGGKTLRKYPHIESWIESNEKWRKKNMSMFKPSEFYSQISKKLEKIPILSKIREDLEIGHL